MKILAKHTFLKKIHQILPDDIRNLSIIFKMNNFDMFLVGGCVRDTFLNKESKDFDVCTNATPTQIKSILTFNNIPFNEQGVHFGIIVAKLSQDVEIATFRADFSSDTGNNKDTEVKFGVTLLEDLERRDLTINAIALNLSNNEIIDPFNGIEDLKNGIIRTVGKAHDRFLEDNLRKLRAVKFCTRFGFTLHQDIIDNITTNPALNISKERVVIELQNAFDKCKDVNLLINLLNTLNLTNVIFDNLITTNNNISITSFNSFLLSFIDNKNTNIKEKLLGLKFSSKTAHTIDTIIKLKNHFKTLDCFDVVKVNKALKKCDISLNDVLSFIDVEFVEQVKFLWNFEIDKNIVQQFIDSGIQGKDLGDAISQWANHQFRMI